MLKSINTRFLIFGLLILLFFIPLFNGEYVLIYILNFVTIFTCFFTINSALYKTENYFTRKRLGLIVFFYSALFVIINKLISYYYSGNFFVFSVDDALAYHEGAVRMASQSFFCGIDLILNEFEFEDIGAFVVMSSLYRIIESILIVNLFYIYIGVVTAWSIFRISKNFMSIKYSFLCALTYSISSFIIWFHSSGLKESFLVMLIVLFYDHYYLFIKSKQLKNLILLIVFLLSILLFRPAITFFCVGSIGISMLFKIKGKLQFFFLIMLGVAFVVFMYSYISLLSDRYLLGGTEQMLAIKEATGMVKQGSVQFTYAVNAIASLLGPLPSVLPTSSKQHLSFFSIGLIYRVFISMACWAGVYYAIKNKMGSIYPLLLFMFIEMASLIYILESLELRKSLPHIPFVFICSFWFLDNYDKKTIGSKQSRLRLRNIWNVSSVLFFFIIIYWNFK